MFAARRAIRFLAVHALAALLAVAGLAPRLVRAAEASVATVTSPETGACCCGTAKGRCCGTACCGAPASKPGRSLPQTSPPDRADLPPTDRAVALQNAGGHAAQSLSLFRGDSIADPAAATLQGRHVRMQV
jgi:hypothetical protein